VASPGAARISTKSLEIGRREKGPSDGREKGEGTTASCGRRKNRWGFQRNPMHSQDIFNAVSRTLVQGRKPRIVPGCRPSAFRPKSPILGHEEGKMRKVLHGASSVSKSGSHRQQDKTGYWEERAGRLPKRFGGGRRKIGRPTMVGVKGR